jgi:hypothetical protein
MNDNPYSFSKEQILSDCNRLKRFYFFVKWQNDLKRFFLLLQYIILANHFIFCQGFLYA